MKGAHRSVPGLVTGENSKAGGFQAPQATLVLRCRLLLFVYACLTFRLGLGLGSRPTINRGGSQVEVHRKGALRGSAMSAFVLLPNLSSALPWPSLEGQATGKSCLPLSLLRPFYHCISGSFTSRSPSSWPLSEPLWGPVLG